MGKIKFIVEYSYDVVEQSEDLKYTKDYSLIEVEIYFQ